MKKDKLFIASSMVLVLALAGCQKKADGSVQKPPVAVTVTTVKPQLMPAFFEATGTTEAYRFVQVRARVDGFLQQREYKEGSFVQEGQTMFRLDPKPFEVALQGAKAFVSQAQAAAENARLNFERIKPLYDNKAASRQELDGATAAKLQTQASVEAAIATVANAQLNLSYTIIKAPVSGFADKAQLHEGAFISSSQNGLLTSVSQIDPLYVSFTMSENQHLAVQSALASGRLSGKSDTAQIVLADGKVYEQSGKVDFSSPFFDPNTGAMSYRVVLKNPKGTLKPGQFVRVKLEGGNWNEAVTVPQRALQQGQKGRFVITVKDGKAVANPIEIGEWVGDKVIVKSGLKIGDVVVVDGAIKAMPGAPLKILGEANITQIPQSK